MTVSYKMPAAATGRKHRFIPLMLAGIILLAFGCTAPRDMSAAAGKSDSPQAASAGSDMPAAVTERLEAAFAALNQAGFEGVIAISSGGESNLVRGFGLGAATGIPTGDTQIDVGSITKTITGVMVMKLVESGALSLETTLGEVFPDVPADKAGINVHQLLTHSAGFVDAVGSDEEVLERDAFLTRAWSTQLEFQPGTDYTYSNVGFSILAAIIEIRSGMTYEDYLMTELLGETEIRDVGYQSVFDPARSMLSPGGETIAEISWSHEKPYWNLIGNGGLIMTPNSLIAFRKAFLAGELVSPESVTLIQTPHVREGEGAPSFYGYGLVVQDHPALGRFYWHNGGNMIFTANWTDYADKGYLVVASASSRGVTADDAVMKVTGALLDLKLGMARPDEEQTVDEATIENVKALSLAFLEAVASPAEADWQAFLEKYAEPGFLAIAPMDVHMSIFGNFHVALDGFERQQIAMTSPDEILIELANGETGEAKTVILGYENGKLAGAGIED